MKKSLLLVAWLLMYSIVSVAQNRTITGTVTDKLDGQPIPGASVIVKGTTLGTQTNIDGKFSLSIPTATKTIQFSYIGYRTREVTLGSGSVYNIAMEQDSKQLGEVVVTALGVGREKKSLGYSATKVSSEEINKAAPVNVMSGLQGKVAGVDISSTGGAPGGSSKVVLRGFSSITGNNQPLFVIDGVPVNNTRAGGTSTTLTQNYDFGNGMNDINPNDIESVNILKGTAASSLYGSRGANGVVVITTKKGKSGALKVDFTSAASFTQISYVPAVQKNYGQGWDGTFIVSENGSWGPTMDGVVRPWGAVVDNTQMIKPFSFVEDNFRNAFDTGGEFNNTISLSGGGENATFYLSYGNIASNGMLPGDNDSYKRNNFSLNGSTKFKKFKAGAGFNYVGKNQKFVEIGQSQGGIGGSFYEEILQIPVDIPIEELQDYKNTYMNVDNYFTPFAENPYYPLAENSSNFKSNRIYGDIKLEYQATNWLSLMFQQGADITNATNKIWHAKNAPSPGSWNDGANPEGAQRQADVGNVMEGSEKYFEYDSKLHANFERAINTDLGISGLVGLAYNDRGFRTLYTSVENLTIPNFYDVSNSLNPPVSTERESHRRLIGLYGSATLAYKNFAYLTLSARNDWSSTLPEGDNSFFYPSISGALVVSDMTDLSKTNINFLKIRASWGQTGNDAAPYSINNILRSANIPVRGGGTLITFPIAGVPGFSIDNTLRNPQLKPEISTETELGAEMKFLDNRLGFDFTYYNKVSKDQILPIDASPSSGYKLRIVNFGKLRNRGIELAVNGTPVRTKDFNWDIGYTFAQNRNEVLELPEGLTQIELEDAYDAKLLAKVGKPLGVITASVPKLDPEGRIIVNADNGYAVPNQTDGEFGTTQRDFTMGLTNSLSYKGFTLGFVFDWRKGGVFYSGTADLLTFTGNAYHTTYNERKPFIIPNSVNEIDNGNGTFSYVENTTPITENNVDDYYYHTSNKALAYYSRIFDRSFIKLREVTLSYQLPAKWLGSIKASGASISVFGRNLWMWLPEENRTIDPEVSNFGNDLTSEFGEFRTGPSTRTFGASLKVSF
ncbi:SusC/RagA family TonB-linked outer membrane protein [Solitalea lacus]|uniref:SusC/RagA family TonB-linked outer membrane protein n=1 Tax=Solitalea lacus TaxID=2911172 RepID=UPI001EDC374B|nr:SusC/RagA family TonB-linked outer membrane protein [Solitalea lacus]UKJ07689.1 SusC/RagA family TonB-linked outer membrane protein [Solitalea lacus]